VLFDKGITTLIQYPAGDPATDYTIPGTVTAISDYAFQDSSNLTGAMHIPTGVTSIGNYAFQNCTGLGGVSIPSSVTSIGYAPFYSCISLTAITVDGNNKNYSNNIVGGVADGVLFNKGKTTLIQYPQDKSGDYVIPAGVTSIGYNAFASCTKLTGITFPSGITGIAQGEFLSCTSLTTVIIPASVTHIDNSAFAYCYNLASVSNTPGGTTLPGSITSIGDYAFIDTGLTSVTIPAGVASIGNDAFYNCNKLASLTFATPSQVTGIGAYAFFHCSNLTSVTIPAGVTTIGNQAFYYCTALTKAKFAGNAPTTMGGNVFDLAAAGFQVDYYSNATGFTTPTWDGYASVAESPGSTMTNWMVKKGYPSTTDPLSVPNFGGVSLLLAYALNIDPSQNMIASLPKAAVAGNQFGFSFYAGCPDVTYIVEISSDCKNWSNSGVTVSTQDANGNRTATIPVSNGPHFMRLRVSY